jgi:hypothetical protein
MSNTTRAFCRCNSGHYFAGETCPYDGWSSPASRELTLAAERLTRAGKEVTLEELRGLGVSNDTLWRTIIISFGVGASMFEAISPATCVVDGEAKPPLKLGRGFK